MAHLDRERYTPEPHNERYGREDGRFDKLIAELGIALGQFTFEVSKFDLSPREWLKKRLATLGYIKASEAPKCQRPCCQTGR